MTKYPINNIENVLTVNHLPSFSFLVQGHQCFSLLLIQLKISNLIKSFKNKVAQ